MARFTTTQPSPTIHRVPAERHVLATRRPGQVYPCTCASMMSRGWKVLTPLYVTTRVLSGLGDGLACAEVCHDALVDLSRKGAFKASDDLAFGPAIGGASGDVELSNNSIAALVRAAGLMSAWPVTGRTVRLGGRTSQSTGAGSRSEPTGAPHDSRGTTTVGSRGVAIVVLQHATETLATGVVA